MSKRPTLPLMVRSDVPMSREIAVNYGGSGEAPARGALHERMLEGMTAAGRVLTHPRVRFVLWAVVGAGGCLALLGALSIGIFVAPMVALLAFVLLLTTEADGSIMGSVSGISAPLFYVAWLNREGPGEVCRVEEHFTECAERWNPWPWLVAGLAFASVGIAVFHRLGHKRVPA